jgi:hypothetical protein
MSRTDLVIARLAAANPVPSPLSDEALRERLRERLGAPPRPRRRRTRTLVAALVALGVAAPAAAFADRIGTLVGLSNQGTPVPTSDLPEWRDTKLAEAMQELRFPSQMQKLGERAGISFYASRRADGALCVAVDSSGGSGVGCTDRFPSPGLPVLDFSHFRAARTGVVDRLAGFAADGVASVAVVDDAGTTIASAPVVDNLYAAVDLPQVPAAAVVARDSAGNELHRDPVRR